MTYNDLKEAAEKATPGPWRRGNLGYGIFQDKHAGDEQAMLCRCPVDKEIMPAQWSRDAAFIALANPAAVLALIERLEEALAWKRANAAQCDTLLRERDAAVSAARNCANAARVAELEQWKESAMRVLGEHHGALQRHGTLGESTADCMDRLARQVAALADALEEVAPDPDDNEACARIGHGPDDFHSASQQCPVALRAQAALRAVGRKT